MQIVNPPSVKQSGNCMSSFHDGTNVTHNQFIKIATMFIKMSTSDESFPDISERKLAKRAHFQTLKLFKTIQTYCQDSATFLRLFAVFRGILKLRNFILFQILLKFCRCFSEFQKSADSIKRFIELLLESSTNYTAILQKLAANL